MGDREALIDKARGIDILEAALRMGAALRRSSPSEHCGPCPMCGGHDRFSVNTRKQIFHCRNCMSKGDPADVIALTMKKEGKSFEEAVEWLTNQDMPSRPVAPRADREAAETKYREKEIDTARGIWRAGGSIEGTPAEAYLEARGIDHLPPGYELRFIASQPYWHAWKGEAEPSVIHRGAVLLGKVTDDKGDIIGCHITWLDADRPGDKVKLPNRDWREGDNPKDRFLDPKKLRGSKRRAAERIQTPKGGGKRLVIGEGRETVLSVWLAERATMKASWSHYWSAIDLGHLAGKAASQVNHPTLKGPKGRPARVGIAVPAEDATTILIPDEVTEIVLLGDGDSEHFATELALRRAAARYERQGRVIKIAWAPEGQDFNDLLGVA